jgi:hypothetical protein
MDIHYNQFTIDYINAVQRNLKIEFDSEGNALYIPDKIEPNDIINLKNDLQAIWYNSKSAIDLVQSKYDATIQSGLFGLVNEMDTALKVGFLIGDRVVLIDYLFERLLLKKEPEKINRVHLGVIASSLVNTLPLAERGRIVIIPNPFNWNPESKAIINEVAIKTTLSTDLISLLNMLSITKICNLHPYTIAESKGVYSSIINTQIDKVESIGRDGEEFAYDGILGALLSEKLLKETELKIALDIPLSKYFDIISSNKDFYLKYLSEITAGGSLSGQNNIDSLRNSLVKSIEEKNKIGFPTLAKVATITAGLSSGAIGLASAVTILSAPLIIAGAILALSSTLTGLVNSKDRVEQPIISVFNKLYNA